MEALVGPVPEETVGLHPFCGNDEALRLKIVDRSLWHTEVEELLFRESSVVGQQLGSWWLSPGWKRT
eukprot:7409056-Prorocentrum_lima.AAC.1